MGTFTRHGEAVITSAGRRFASSDALASRLGMERVAMLTLRATPGFPELIISADSEIDDHAEQVRAWAMQRGLL